MKILKSNPIEMISGDCQAAHTWNYVRRDGRDQVWFLQGENNQIDSIYYSHECSLLVLF